MLDSVTKKRIDDLRNILVGKIPSPQSQVEQITTGLIYKFMYDMDVEAVEMGGVASFFVGDYVKYSWKNLFDPKLGGTDKVQLYSDAIENMYTNPSAPQLFREIFKNSFLPFKDPSTLNMFLKEINEFHYSHSEKLGDAFEYLLSFMGSQGDAGQFRTPRHIIDFIVEIVNPKKNETILDPACGTAGFLISSYKHILSQNTDKKLGDKLNASERKQVGDNLVGYDISPDMTRISLVNMYLHQFASPQIHEYDTLSSEDRWNEYYDVILANPPFMTPKGGIQPHARFGVQSKKAEVLFVDYIMEHLKPNGRAGIVVPEGIIFQNGTAYKKLRKKLVESSLVGVISLPAGVFKPYSGVKTSILLLDKQESGQRENIFFSIVENDGFSLGDKRTPIKSNDLPNLVSVIQSRDEDELFFVSKDTILDHTSVSLSQSNYQTIEKTASEYPMVRIGEFCDLMTGATPLTSEPSNYENGEVPWLVSGDIHKGIIKDCDGRISARGLETSSAKYLPMDSVLIALNGQGKTRGTVAMLKMVATCNQSLVAIKPKDTDTLDSTYLYFCLKAMYRQIREITGDRERSGLNMPIIKDIKIPLPPIEVQQQIVDELEGYQKIIDGCRQVVENYKPTIDIDPSWEMVELGEVVEFSQGVQIPKEEQHTDETSGKRFLRIIDFTQKNQEPRYVSGDYSKYWFDEDDVGLVRYGTVGFVCSGQSGILANNMFKVSVKSERLMKGFLKTFLRSTYFQSEISRLSYGAALQALNFSVVGAIKIFLPPQEIQNEIVNELQSTQHLVNSCESLIEKFSEKMRHRLDKVWGE